MKLQELYKPYYNSPWWPDQIELLAGNLFLCGRASGDVIPNILRDALYQYILKETHLRPMYIGKTEEWDICGSSMFRLSVPDKFKTLDECLLGIWEIVK